MAEKDNVIYIDEFRRERWLLKLEIARDMGGVAVFNAENPDGEVADVIPFPGKEGDPDGAA